MYSMVPLQTLLQVRGGPTVDAAAAAAAVAVSSSGSELQLPSVKQEGSAVVDDSST
jgi:hypothetical protein